MQNLISMWDFFVVGRLCNSIASNLIGLANKVDAFHTTRCIEPPLPVLQLFNSGRTL